jgi:hypothetical protein
VSNLAQRFWSKFQGTREKCRSSAFRCHLESLEPRMLLAADIFMQSVATDGNNTLSLTYEIHSSGLNATQTHG